MFSESIIVTPLVRGNVKYGTIWQRRYHLIVLVQLVSNIIFWGILAKYRNQGPRNNHHKYVLGGSYKVSFNSFDLVLNNMHHAWFHFYGYFNKKEKSFLDISYLKLLIDCTYLIHGFDFQKIVSSNGTFTRTVLLTVWNPTLRINLF